MKIVRVISKVFMTLCMLCIFILMMLMVSEVLIRAIFNKSIIGSTEWAQILLLCNMTALSSAILSNRQIKINIFTSNLRAKTQVILDIVILILSCCVIAVLAWQQAKFSIKTFHNNVVYTTINVAHWPFIAVFSIAYAVGALTTLLLVIRKIVAMATGNWSEEAVQEDLDEIFAYGKKKLTELKSRTGKNGSDNKGSIAVTTPEKGEQ